MNTIVKKIIGIILALLLKSSLSYSATVIQTNNYVYSNSVTISNSLTVADVIISNNSIYINNIKIFSLTNDQLTIGVPIVGSNTVSFTPYIMTYALTQTVSLANGNYQYYHPTNITTLVLPSSPTNQFHSVLIDIDIGTNSFTINTNNVCFLTNDVIGVGVSSLIIQTNGVTTSLMFNKAYNNVNWRVGRL